MLKFLRVSHHSEQCSVLMDFEGRVFGTLVYVPGTGFAYNFNGEMGTASTRRSARSILASMGYHASL